jgi:hypothetical protein
MSFMGRLEDFLLPEVLKVIGEGRKTGLLSLRIFDPPSATFIKREVWAVNGAIAERSDLPSPVTIEALFNLSQGFFTFDERTIVPTNLSRPIAANLLTLKALQQVTQWDIYTKKYPEPYTSLLQVGPLSAEIKELLRSAPLEANILTYCHGRTSIQQLGQIFNQPLARIQKAAFCLIIAGIVEELPIVIIDAPPTVRTNATKQSTPTPKATTNATPSNTRQTQSNTKTTTPAVSNQLLGALTQFLNQRIKK